MIERLWAPALALIVACGPSRRAAEPEEGTVQLPTEMVLTDPDVVDLGLPDDLVRDGVCHTQGLAFDRGELVLSCVVYDPKYSDTKTEHSHALILRRDADGQRPWLTSDITEPVSVEVSQRITRHELERDELTDDELGILRVMSHPSGLVRDSKRGGVWVANAVYTAESHTRFVLLGDDNGPLRAIELPGEHVGAISLVRERFLVGWTWDSKNVVFVDVDDPTSEPVIVPNPLLDTEDLVAIQDCYTWDDDHVLCSGMYKYATGEGADEIKHRIGRLQLLRVDVSSFPSVSIRHAGYMAADFGAGPSVELGLRRYRVDEDDEEVFLHENDYGGYRTPNELTHEGMTLSDDRRHMYFVPDDLPEGKMIRMTVKAR